MKKRSSPSVFVIIDLAKPKIVDPTKWNKPPPHCDAHRQTHNRPPRSRRTLGINEETEKDHIWSTLRCLAAQKGGAINFAKERRREPLRHRTAARRRKFLSRQSTRQTIYSAKSPPRAE
jgi:hypothetical protein